VMQAHAITDGETVLATTILQILAAALRDPTQPLSPLVRFAVKQSEGEKVEAASGRARRLKLNEPGCRAFADPRRAHVRVRVPAHARTWDGQQAWFVGSTATS
jgi:hypothetical protein